MGYEAGRAFEVVSEVLVPEFAAGGLALSLSKRCVVLWGRGNSPPESSYGVCF